ncbi:MAG: hypothetical protein JW804_08805, partial [Sedimentisphaerales bacterium]|nr:hypothetical protein [Sedimentisphaerales bacterium]
FDTLIYKCILKARSIAPKDINNKIKLNGSVHYLIDKCFFNNQLMTIRRLTDKKGPDIVSLCKLLNQMKGNCKYLTRRNYFMILHERGYEYDYSETKKKEDEYISKNLRMGEVIAIPDELDWEKSARLHFVFDKLSKSNSSNGKPEDIISTSVFDKLLKELDCCDKLREYIDNFIAHSLKPEKIEKLDDKALRVTFEHLWEVQQIICKVTNFIGLYLLGIADYELLPVPYYGFLHYIEEPLVSKEGKTKLHEEEDKFRNEIRSWKIKIDEFL